MNTVPLADRLETDEIALEFDLEYSINENILIFFGGSLIDESEALKPNGSSTSVSGYERGVTGISASFGEAVESEIAFGRLEFTEPALFWWNDDIDAIRFQAAYGDFELMLGRARELAREASHEDFIDPEIKDLDRTLLSLHWELTGGQSIAIYYLDQVDGSNRYRLDESVNVFKIDEEDADLTWSGVGYSGEFEWAGFGDLAISADISKLSGNETIYEFEDPVSNLSVVGEVIKNKVDASAKNLRVSWTPEIFEAVTFTYGFAQGSGDKNLNDNINQSFRQTGLLGDAEIYGELYQPELSNLQIDILGIEYEISDSIKLGVFSYAYQQDELAEDMRDVSIDLALSGLSKGLGREIDLVLSIEELYGFELELIVAEFKAGGAYGSGRNQTSRYWKIGVGYLF